MRTPLVLLAWVALTLLAVAPADARWRHRHHNPTSGACGIANGVPVSSAPTSGLCAAGSTSAVTGDGPWSWTCYGTNGGTSAMCSAPLLTGGGDAPYPQTAVHYAPNGNFDGSGTYLPGADGFNLADLGDVGTLNSLPPGVKGLVWVGLCNGADTNFVQTVQPFIGNPNLYGFYLMDEPDPTGQYGTYCQSGNLKAEADWIHANVPGAQTFIVLMNMGTDVNPSYAGTYNPANSDVDLYGIDPYPCQQSWDIQGCNYDIVAASVQAAVASGISAAQLVPVYQAFGGGGYTTWTLPTQAEEEQILAAWAAALPSAVFDYAYSWGSQNGDQSIATTNYLQTIYTQKNAGQTLP